MLTYGFVLISMWSACFVMGGMSNSYTAAMGMSFTFLSIYFLQKEYDFWMANQEHLSESNPISSHTVLIKGKYVMNRYNDKLNSPRSEMYVDDVHLAGYSERNQDSLFSHLRAACESGWDFSSRWCSDPMDLKTIHTGDIVPVDLNCLIYRMESTLSHCYDLAGDDMRANKYLKLSERRQKVIEKLFWDKEEEFYFDFDISKNSITNVASLAGIFPLFFEISDVERAENCLSYLEKHFLKKGGLVTTNINSGQQWDAPNGWAPLQWVGFIAAINYQNKVLADCISHRWTQLNDKVFKKTGKMMEKYNVEDPMLESGGGEYPVQDGFGWSNGVYLAMKAMQY